MKRANFILIALLFMGCPEVKPTPDASMDVPVEVVEEADAGPPAPAELTFAIDFLGLDGGVSSVLSAEKTAEIEPSRSALIRFGAVLKDYRVRLFDNAERVLVSDEEARVEDGGMSYQIFLEVPLKAGRSYSFSVEAELGHEITDVSGRGYRDVRVELKVRGELEPEPKPARKRPKVKTLKSQQ